MLTGGRWEVGLLLPTDRWWQLAVFNDEATARRIADALDQHSP